MYVCVYACVCVCGVRVLCVCVVSSFQLQYGSTYNSLHLCDPLPENYCYVWPYQKGSCG